MFLNVSNRQDVYRNGWGYSDTHFYIGDDDILRLSGKRYSGYFQGDPTRREFPDFVRWAEDTIGLDVDEFQAPVSIGDGLYSNATISQEFLKFIEGDSELSFDTTWQSRLSCSHGHTMQEIFALRRLGVVPWRIADAVVSPETHESVERLVKYAVGSDEISLVPVGGGTNVTHALIMAKSSRVVVAVDMKRMNKIVWIDRDNMNATIQAGALGKEIESKLDKLGLTTGHEPDSSEFSSIGGWVATKSSGMKKNVYGNIEDIVLNVKMVTCAYGTLTRKTSLERVSIGPDVVKLAIGSEGAFGIITEVTVRLRLKPTHSIFESYVFADFAHGVSAMREIALHRVAPASVRLMDNTQFKMGQALKPPGPLEGTAFRWQSDLLDKTKKYYVTEYRGFSQDALCAMVLLFEGSDRKQLRNSEASIASICRKYGGIRSGGESGRRGYFLTFMIAYLRDFGVGYGFLSESFETSVKWTDVNLVYERVKARIGAEAAKEGVCGNPLVAGRVTQTYDSCAAMYFYFGILELGLKDPIGSFSRIEDAARDEILLLGGSLSHHHGVGKIRQKFYGRATSTSEQKFLVDLKSTLDPRNIFAASNLGFAPSNKL